MSDKRTAFLKTLPKSQLIKGRYIHIVPDIKEDRLKHIKALPGIDIRNLLVCVESLKTKEQRWVKAECRIQVAANEWSLTGIYPIIEFKDPDPFGQIIAWVNLDK